MSAGDAEGAAGVLRWWRAPAKLNLCLHVVGRRPDGYHELQTVFQLIDLCDLLAFELDPTGDITRVDDAAAAPGALAAVAADADLTVRAARALQAASGTPLGVRIRVRKRIPMGGGLGGGSSDAATTLRVLDRLWGTALGTEALAALGLGLEAHRSPDIGVDRLHSIDRFEGIVDDLDLRPGSPGLPPGQLDHFRRRLIPLWRPDTDMNAKLRRPKDQ